MSLRSEQVQVPPAAVTRRPSHPIHSFDFPFPSSQGFCAHSLGGRGRTVFADKQQFCTNTHTLHINLGSPCVNTKTTSYPLL